jgi:undecaprenyl-diphosphatase
MWEVSFMQWMESVHSHILDVVMTSITYCATYSAIWLSICLLMLSKSACRKYVPAILVSILLAYIVCDFVLKPLVGRERPYDAMDLEPIVAVSTSFSFPSGHTASSFAAATALYLYDRRYGIPALVFAALVGISRVYLLVHWPTDVIAGAMIGMVCALSVYAMMNRMFPRREI